MAGYLAGPNSFQVSYVALPHPGPPFLRQRGKWNRDPLFILIGLVSGGLIEVALPTLVHGPLHGNASAFGIILVAWGAGAFVGAIVAGALAKANTKGSSCLLRVRSWPL